MIVYLLFKVNKVGFKQRTTQKKRESLVQTTFFVS